MPKRAIVTGGMGFIGGYVVERLHNEGFEVHVLDILPTSKRVLPQEVYIHNADIRDENALLEIIKEGDYIFHLAALTSVQESLENPLPYHDTNIRGTYTLLEVARKKKVSGVIFSSSASVYGSQEGKLTEDTDAQPESPYALQKYLGEELCKRYTSIYKLPTVILRYFNVYGEGAHESGSYAPVIARFLKCKRENKPLPIVGDGEQTRDFIHVLDVAEANVRSIKILNPDSHHIINVCTGKPLSVKYIASIIGGETVNLPARIEIKHSSGDPSLLQNLLELKPRTNIAEEINDLMK